MAEFNAGSIEARLELNREGFTAGLDEAKAQARSFEDNNIEAKVRVDTGDSEEKIAALDADLEAIPNDKTSEIHVKVDKDQVAEAEKAIGSVRTETDKLATSAENASGSVRRMGSSAASAGGPGGGIGLLAGAIGGLLPLLNPLLGLGIGMVGSLGVAATGIGAFAAFAIPTFKQIETAQKAVDTAQKAQATSAASNATQNAASLAKVQAAQEKLNAETDPKKRVSDLAALQSAQASYNQVVLTNSLQQKQANDAVAKAEAGLTPPMKEVLTAYQGLKTEFKSVQEQVAPGIAKVFTGLLNTASAVLPQIAGLVNSTSTALQGVTNQLKGFLLGPQFHTFVSFVSQNIGPQLQNLSGGMFSLLGGFMNLIERSKPLMDAFNKIWTSLTTGFDKMTVSPSFTAFIDAVAKDMPAFAKLGGDLFKTIGDILVHLEPAVGPLLNFLDVLVKAIDQLVVSGALDALVQLLIALLNAFAPSLPMIAQILNQVLPPLVSVLVPILQALTPLMPVIVPVLLAMWGLNKLEGPLTTILGLVTKIAGFAGLKPAAGSLWEKILGTGTKTGGGIAGEAAATGGGGAAGVGGALAAGAGLLVGAGAGFAGGIALGNLTEPGKGTQARVGRDLTAAGGGLIGLGGAMAATGVGVIPGAVVAAVGAVAVGAGEIVDHWKPVKQAFDDTGKSATDMYNKHIAPALKSAGKDATGFGSTVKKGVTGAFADAQHWLSGAGGSVVKGFTDAAHKAWDPKKSFMENIKQDLKNITADTLRWLFNAGKDVVTGLVEGAKGGWKIGFKWFPRILEDLLHWAKDANTWLWHTGYDIIDGMWSGIKKAWELTKEWFPRIVEDLLHWGKTANTWLWSTGWDIISGLYNGIITAFPTVLNFFLTFPLKLYGWFNKARAWLLNAGWDIISGLFDGITKAFPAVGNFFQTLKDKIVGAIGDLGHILYNIGKGILDGLFNGMRRAWDDSVGWLGSLAGKIANIKGPYDKDLHLLEDNGKAIMQGLHTGLKSGWGDVENLLSGMAPQISGTIGTGASGGGGGGGGDVHVTINNPVGETTDSSLHRTMSKLRFHGLLPVEAWDLQKIS